MNGENAVNRYKYYTEVNNLSKYAVTRRIIVKVTDRNNMPVQDASVEYQLYNYAEFYPLAVVPTDKNGISQFETGLGDLLVWAYYNDTFNFQKISVGETDTLTLVLDRLAGGSYSIDLDLEVPPAPAPLPGPSQEMTDSNTARINRENEIRRKYIDSWMNAGEAKSFAIGLNADTARVMNIIARSMGNFKEIRSFLSETPDSLLTIALRMLELLPDKDLRDTKGSILSDHLLNTVQTSKPAEYGEELFLEYILNPRIANEIITSWRSFFRKELPAGLPDNAAARSSGCF